MYNCKICHKVHEKYRKNKVATIRCMMDFVVYKSLKTIYSARVFHNRKNLLNSTNRYRGKIIKT